jgi:hypothetical protein
MDGFGVNAIIHSEKQLQPGLKPLQEYKDIISTVLILNQSAVFGRPAQN